MRKVTFVAVLALSMVLVACSSSDGGGEATTSPGSTGSTGSDCPDLTAGDTFTLTISDFAFSPDCLTARAAQGITIVNQDTATHSFTIEGTQVDVTVEGGSTFNGEPVTGVLAPGTYDFSCRFHPQMTGTITVE